MKKIIFLLAIIALNVNAQNKVSLKSTFSTEIIYFNGINPNTTTPSYHALSNKMYVGTDGSQWIYSVNKYVSADYEAGDVIQVKVFNGTSEIGGDLNPFTTRTVTLPAFTPKSSNSTIIIEFDCDLSAGAFGLDEFVTQIRDASNNVLMDKRSRWNNGGSGAGMRGNPMIPISAKFSNTSTTAKTFNIFINRVQGDDTCTMFAHRIAKITEIQN